ncbi:response regulator [Phenylobacterium montanum]|uniref:response regulator n=1 Tax=Phenylobacterium montanum TaxID=2823693 RepID=UPI002012BF0D|nr:response regulator [Caulobacter sp. S6]
MLNSDTDRAVLVLLVDDEPMIQELVEVALDDAGFAVVSASSGSEALARFEADAVTFDAVVTDINLGIGPDGWDVARRSRQGNPQIPVVYISGASAAEWPNQGVPRSIMIQKPFAPAQIVMAVATLLNTRPT